MNEYLILDDDNRVVGISSVDIGNCVKAHYKPFCREISKWDGEKLVYSFPKVEHIKTEKKETYDSIIFNIGTTYSYVAKYFNGTEKRKHNGDISVLIPCYRKSEYLMTAVKSCFKQTQKPKEIIVLLMDEDSYKLENELTSMGVICYKEKQMNVCKARTYLAKKCKTDWLIFLDADDFLLRDYIKTLDKRTESFCVGKWTVMTASEFNIELWNGDAFYLNKKEDMLRQNMTALMHRDVFFDIGLNEKYAEGGEDFDFLIRLGTKRKWSIFFDDTPLWVYRKEIEGSLTKKKEYFDSYLNVILDNKNIIEKELLAADDVFCSSEQIIYFLNNPSKESLRKLTIFRAFDFVNESKDKFYSDFDFLEDLIRNEFNYYLYESMNRDTKYVFNFEDYEAVNCTDWEKTHLYNSEVQNSTFDVIFFNIDTNDIEKLITEPLSYVTRKDIQKEIKEKKLSNIDTLFYLLKNYSCFIKNDFGGNYPRRLLSQKDNFILALGDIHFDERAEECAQFIKDTITFGVFNTPQKHITHKRSVTFVLHKTCNLNCPYCPQSDKSDPLSDDEIFDNFNRALTKFEEQLGNTFTVQVMGGETTLWSDYLQNKILERCKDFRNLHIFTNGANKDCPLYNDDRVVKHLHLIDWKKQIYTTPLRNELYDLIIEDGDTEGLQILQKYTEGTKLHILPQKKNGCSDLNVSFSFLKELAAINNPLVMNQHIRSFVAKVENDGYDKTRTSCRTGTKPVIEVDCTKMTVRPCSNSRIEYSFDDYDFTKLTPEEECNKCLFTY